MLFLAPVMMQNPEPFSSLSQASEDMILQASVWRAVTQNQANYKETDAQGRMVVPAKDVENASRELFGSAFHLSSKHLQNVVTVEFSSTTQEIAVETYRYILEFDSLSGEPYLSSIQSA